MRNDRKYADLIEKRCAYANHHEGEDRSIPRMISHWEWGGIALVCCITVRPRG